MFSVNQLMHVFVSSDFKYFKVANMYLSQSPCNEILSSSTHMNVTTFPIYLITPFNGATMALLLTTGNIPYEMTLKTAEETLKVFQNLVSIQEAMRLAGDFANIFMYQELFNWFAKGMKEQANECKLLVDRTTNGAEEQSQTNHEPCSFIQEDTSVSTDMFADIDIPDLLGDIDLGLDEQDTECSYETIDDFLNSLCDSNIYADMDTL